MLLDVEVNKVRRKLNEVCSCRDKNVSGSVLDSLH